MRITKNTLVFFILIGSLLLTVIKALQKALILAWEKTLYYCQTILQTISFHFPSSAGLIIATLIILIFIIALLKLLLVILYTFRLKRRLLKKQIPKSKELRLLVKKLKIESITKVIKDKKTFAFCFGLFNPKIYLSTALIKKMTTQELEAVLRHETYHIEYNDTAVMTIAFIGQSLLPFFPLLSDFIDNIQLDREIEADKKVIKAMGNKKILMTTLKKLILYPFPTSGYIQALADYKTLEKRIQVLTGKKKIYNKFNQIKIAISLISFIILLSFIFSPVKAEERYKKTSQGVSICLLGSNCFSRCNQHPYNPPNST